jgi:putative oxidoreductase
MHGQQKVLELGIAQTGEFFAGQGVPLPLLAAGVVTAVEALGGLALILGVFTRVVAALLAVDMAAATIFVHFQNGFFAVNGGVELVLLLGAACLTLLLTGPGAMAADGLLPRERSRSPRGSWRQREDYAR